MKLISLIMITASLFAVASTAHAQRWDRNGHYWGTPMPPRCCWHRPNEGAVIVGTALGVLAADALVGPRVVYMPSQAPVSYGGNQRMQVTCTEVHDSSGNMVSKTCTQTPLQGSTGTPGACRYFLGNMSNANGPICN